MCKLCDRKKKSPMKAVIFVTARRPSNQKVLNKKRFLKIYSLKALKGLKVLDHFIIPYQYI